jgi:hypothetical protein
MSVPVEEIKPKVSEIQTTSGEVISVSWPVPQPSATGMYVTKDDRLVVFLLGPMGGGAVEVFMRIFSPGTGIQILRQRIRLPSGSSQAMYWVQLTEGWVTNISVNAVTEEYAGNELEVRLGLQRGWTTGEFPVIWFAAGFMDFYRGFHWPETHYLRYSRVEFLDYIDTAPGTLSHYEWINTTGYDVIVDSLFMNIKNNDTSARYPVLELRSNGRVVGRQILSGSIAAGGVVDITWFKDCPYMLAVTPIMVTKFPLDRPLKQDEGFRVYLYAASSIPTFNVVRALLRKIVG